ncbi:parathyroid hormone 2 receptor-like isoform X2 [Mytilus galloprovincialis]|uniref:parathyroid hormone 2 receptor-like isoform X2 n=1 Tax=Mytilus galloprovincialis TaxID=29158 RepID=UPI003F7C4FB7
MVNILNMSKLSVFLSIILLEKSAASWCSADSKEVTQLDQLKALNKALADCNASLSEPLNNDTECSGHFDGIMCWPSTKAGEISKRLCPDYIHGFNTSGYATKECLPTGTWYFHPIFNKSFADFAGCIPNVPFPSAPKPTRIELIKSHMASIQIIYRTGYAVSLIFLVIAVVVMTIFSIICFIKDEHGIPEEETNIMDEVLRQLNSSDASWWCKLVHALFFYILVANYMWIFVEGIYLHTLIFVTTFHNISHKMFRVLIVLGWVSPIICVMPWVIVRVIHEDTLCWNLHNQDNGFHWILQGPIIATLSVNFFFFLNIIRVLFTKLSATNSRDPKCYRKLAKSTLVLIPLFGVHYIMFMAIPICLDPEMEVAWLYIELFFSSFQGFAVSMLFCFTLDEVKSEIKKHWQRHMLRRQSMTSTRSTRTFSVQSSGSGHEQESPTYKRQNGLSLITCNSLEKAITNYDTETELYHNNSEENDGLYFDSSVKLKDDNENMPLFSSEIATVL